MDALVTVELEVYMEHIPPGTMINLYDHDLLGDDHLQSEPLLASGTVSLTFHSSRFQKKGLIKEKHPDLYFQIVSEEKLLFTSPTTMNVNLEESASFSSETGYHFHLGKFVIE